LAAAGQGDRLEERNEMRGSTSMSVAGRFPCQPLALVQSRCWPFLRSTAAWWKIAADVLLQLTGR
jgi:hypothetical protein